MVENINTGQFIAFFPVGFTSGFPVIKKGGVSIESGYKVLQFFFFLALLSKTLQ
jgi:hypothetical protein